MQNFVKNDKVWIIENIMDDYVVNNGIFKDEFLIKDNQLYYLVDYKYIEVQYIFKTKKEADDYLKKEIKHNELSK